MELSPVATEILHRVEEVSGTPVEVIADGSLQVLAKVTMAKAGATHHLLRIRLDRDVPDYFIAYECGYILRLYSNPPTERFEFGPDRAGRAEVIELLKAPGGVARKLRLPEAAVAQLASTMHDGLMTQLRSLPIGMCIDQWIYATYPFSLRVDASALERTPRW